MCVTSCLDNLEWLLLMRELLYKPTRVPIQVQPKSLRDHTLENCGKNEKRCTKGFTWQEAKLLIHFSLHTRTHQRLRPPFFSTIPLADAKPHVKRIRSHIANLKHTKLWLKNRRILSFNSMPSYRIHIKPPHIFLTVVQGCACLQRKCTHHIDINTN